MPTVHDHNAVPHRPRRRRWRGRIATASALLMIAGHISAAPAVAAAAIPATSTDAWAKEVGPAYVENQERIAAFRAWMYDTFDLDSTGYVGSIDDIPNKATSIMWYGQRTPVLAKILAEGKRRGIAMSVTPRKNSLQQLQAATDAIWKQHAAGEWAGFEITAILNIERVENGITVMGDYTSTDRTARAAQVQSLTTSVLGIPVRVVPGSGFTPASGRKTDYAPYNAGGFMLSTSTNRFCSSGFAIWAPNARTITARHCRENDYHAFDIAGNSYGAGLFDTANGGARVLGGSGYPWMFDGPYNQVDYTKTVIGLFDPAFGDSLCTSGGNSGIHCSIQVTGFASCNDGTGLAPFSCGFGQKSGGGIAAMEGDSGGAVMSLANTGNGQVRAAGMIQGFPPNTGMTGPGNCGGAWIYGDNQCSAGLVFSTMRTIINSISGASLRTF